jgi:hypothetical protein
MGRLSHEASRSVVALTAINVAVLLITTAQQLRPAFADAQPPVLRGRALEIVDVRGRVRASIDVVPAGASPNGDQRAETVLLRLNTERGRPSIKIGSSEPASGMSITGPTGTSDTYLILQASGTVSSLKLKNEDGRQRVVEP